MRLSEGEASLNHSNGARRITRSSLESVHNALPEKKILKARKNGNISVKCIEKLAICVIGSDLTNVANSRSSKRLITSSQSAVKPVMVKQTAIKKQSVVTKDPKRVTRSSIGSLAASSLRNRSLKSKLVTLPVHRPPKKLIKSKQTRKKNKCVITKDSENVTRSMSETGSTSSLLQSAEKQMTSKPTEEKKDVGVVTEVSKRVTRSSLESATSSTSLRNKNPGHKPPTSQPTQSSRKQVVNEKEHVVAEILRRKTRTSFSKVNNTSVSLRNKSSMDTLVAPPLQPQRLAEKRVKTKRTAKEKILRTVARNSKRLMCSNLEDVSGTSSVTEKTFGSKLVVSPLPPRSAPKTDKYKQTPEETDTVQRVSKQKKCSDTSDLVAILEPVKDKIKKGKSEKSKESDISVNARKMPAETIESTPVTPISSTRNKRNSLQSGSSSSSPSYKNKEILSYSKDIDFFDLSNSSKSYFEEKSEDIQIDCLSNGPLRRTVAKRSCKSINSSLIVLQNTREHKLNATEKEGRNSGQSKISTGVKRKTKVSPRTEGKRKRDYSTTIPGSFEDPTSSIDCLTDRVSNKRPRRHTVDVLLKSKGGSTAPKTQRKSKKTSSAKRTKATLKPANVSRRSLSSRSTPDTSLLPVDCISTFISKRPNSAPAAIKRPYPVKGFNSTIPKKGTLKRRRWMFNALKEKNECYEDDIFENQKFATPFRIPIEPDDESDTSIATPTFGFLLTPALPKKTPKYRDIISPSELLIARKTAEEYLYRRRRKRTSNNNSTLKTPSSSQSSASANIEQVPEKKKLDFAEAMDKIQAVQNVIEKQAQEESGDEDAYFSDVST